jgi:hypothetical protein
MNRLLAIAAGALMLATGAPAAWSQETAAPAAATTAAPEAPADPMEHALATIKSPAATLSDLTDAHTYLVDQRQVSRPLVAQLLADPNAQIRMNAAIVLSSMATAGDTSAATLQALQTAAKDKELAVAYWGFQGLMSDGVPAADQRTVMAEMMKMELPHAVRLAALMTIDRKKPTLAVPIIVSHLQEILKEYRAQVETLVTSAETLTPVTRAPSVVAPAIGVQGPMSAPQPGRPATGGRPAGATPPGNVTTPGAMTSGGRGARGLPQGIRAPTMGRRRGENDNAGGGFIPNAPTARTAPIAPSAARRTDVVVTQVRRIDLENMTLDQLQAQAHGVEALPMVAEVHQMGMVLEDIVANASPDAPLFDFKTTAPWDLDKCVDKAVVYLNSHSADYGAVPAPAPAAAPAAATTNAVPPAAPPAATPAPATTAATPASTTPAP